ncbi:MAG: DUF971 domain-containing protein [Phycisphaerales bacterium]|nr:DUF971 domain-containing protein [Phycisphaerales bacterium]
MISKDTYRPEQVNPSDIKLARAEHRLTVVWKDGHTSVYDLAALRRACPCATCNSERQKKSATTELFPILTKDPGTGPPQATALNLVGNYALHIRWSDGHDTGIYDFRFLRSLDPSEQSS